MTLAAIWTALTSRAGQIVAAIGAALAVVAGAFLRGRKAGRDEVKADAAAAEQKAREKGDEAARDADRDGAARRLSDGRF